VTRRPGTGRRGDSGVPARREMQRATGAPEPGSAVGELRTTSFGMTFGEISGVGICAYWTLEVPTKQAEGTKSTLGQLHFLRLPYVVFCGFGAPSGPLSQSC